MQRWLWRIFGVLLVAVLATMMVRAYMPKPIQVDVVEVEQKAFVSTLEYTGQTRVRERFTLLAPINGSLRRILLSEGDQVTPQTLAAQIQPMMATPLDARSRLEAEKRIDSAKDAHQQAVARVAAQKENLREAQREYTRLQTLRSQEAATSQEADRAQSQFRREKQLLVSAEFAAKVAQHEWETAKAVLESPRGNLPSDMVSVYAPIQGVVLKILRTQEGPLTAGTPLMEVGSLESLEAIIEVQTPDALRLKPGMKVWLEEWGGPMPLEGHIHLIEPSAFTDVSPLGVEEQRVNVRVDFLLSGNLETRLGDGYDVTARFILWEQDHVLQIPASAPFRKDKGWSVFVIENEIASERGVRLGHRNSSNVEVLEGVQAKEWVIVHPSEHVEAGAKVKSRRIP